LSFNGNANHSQQFYGAKSCKSSARFLPNSIKIRVAREVARCNIRANRAENFFENCEENPLSKIARRQFMQLSAVAAAGLVVSPGREAQAQDLPKIEESDPVAQSLKYTHDASSVDPASRANPAADQTCVNCALVQGADGDDWRPCQIFPGKSVAAAGWCSVWAPKA
jgi:hypothetical protein